MVVARNRSTMDALIKMIAARDVSRQYLAIAHKEWGARKRREVNAPIGRDPRNRLRMAVVDLNLHPGKQAQTDFDWLAGDASHTLVRCTLHTGRTHQIRVHMASLGHPLIADTLYGGHPEGGLERQALHAFRLAFEHPVSKTAGALCAATARHGCSTGFMGSALQSPKASDHHSHGISGRFLTSRIRRPTAMVRRPLPKRCAHEYGRCQAGS